MASELASLQESIVCSWEGKMIDMSNYYMPGVQLVNASS